MNKSKRDEMADRIPKVCCDGAFRYGWDSGFAEAQEQAKVLVEYIKQIDSQNDDRCWYNVESLCKEALEQYRKAME